jgi:hypothetical protein
VARSGRCSWRGCTASSTPTPGNGLCTRRPQNLAGLLLTTPERPSQT